MSATESDRQDGNRFSEGFDNLSFAGCGFLGIYHVGVASCFKEYAPHLFSQRVSGASAGALVACALVTGSCLGECTTFTLKLALQARSRTLGPLSPSFHLVKSLRKALWNFLPDNAHEIASGRLFVSLTRVRDQKNVLVSQFSDKNDLIDALICSSFVPLYSGIMPPSYRGVRYVDGALSDNVPIWNKSTITVSPFAGESDVCPDDVSCNLHHINLAGTSVQFTAGNLYRLSVAFFPPTPEVLSNMCRQGFDDALRFLKRNRLISCTQHLSIKSDIISSSPLAFALFNEDAPADEDKMNAEYSVTVHPTSSEEDEDSSCCDECEERERLALQDSPPLLVTTALQAACDEANKGFMAKIYNSRIYQVLSLMATPYVLPFEVGYQLIKKLYDWGPYMPEDMQWFIRGLYNLSLDLLSSCESAIKGESSSSSLQLNHFAVSLGVYFGINANQKQHRKTSVHRKKSSSSRPVSVHGQHTYQSLPDETDAAHLHHHYHHHHQQTLLSNQNQKPVERLLDESDRNYSINFGININNYVQSPVQCARSARDHIPENHKRDSTPVTGLQTTELSSQEPTIDEPPFDLMATSNLKWLEDSNECYDTFENCLHIAKQMDSILAYYYLEEDDPTKVKVVEIFPVLQGQSLKTEGQNHDRVDSS